MFEKFSEAIPREFDIISVQRLIEYLFLNCAHKNSLVMESNLDLIKTFVELLKRTNIYAAAAKVVGLLLKVRKLNNESNYRLLEQLSFILKWHNSQNLQNTFIYYKNIILKLLIKQAMIPNITKFDFIYLELKAAEILDIIIHKDFSIRSVALRLLHKLLPKLTHEQLFEIAQTLPVDGPNECQHWTLEIYKWMYDYITQYITNEVNISLKSMSEKFYHHVREQLLQLLSSKNEYIRVNCRNFWCDPKRLSILSHHRLITLVDQLYSIKTENEYLNYCTNFLLERTTHNPDYNRFIFENPLDKCIFQEFPLVCNWRQQHHTYMTPLFTLQSQTTNDPINTNIMTMDPVHFMETLTYNNNNIDQQQNPTTEMILQTQEISNRQQFIPTQVLDNNTNYNWLKQTNTFDTTNTYALPTLSTQNKTTSLIVNVENKNQKSKINSLLINQSNINENNEDDIFRLKRRFLKDTGKLHSYFARKQNEKKQKEKQFLNEIKLKQENQVEKYRTYRIGELPDIQIRFSDIIIPLQALAQYDDHIARLLYSNLFTSILTSLEDKLLNDEYIELIDTIQHRFNVMLSQSEIFYPSFILSLFDIILSKSKQIKISSQYISASAIASHLEPIGILTLECFIHLNQTNELNQLIHESVKKKFKSDPDVNKQLYKDVDYWLELAKCYRSIINYDDVRGIFCQISSLKSLTLKAIEEESHSDFLSALNTYVTALEQYPLTDDTINDSVLELEHEFWTQSMLNCCNQLTTWTIMSKHIFIANTTFDTLWSNAYQLNYLMPYAIRSKLKLLISGTEQEQLEQEGLCQFFNNLSATTNVATPATSDSETTFVKRSYIEKQYPFELATFFLYQKDFDPPRSQQQQQQEVVTQPEEEEEEEEVLSILPRTPPCLPAPPVLSPRQSTPRTPVAPPRLLQSSPQPEPSVQIENNQIKEQVIPMEQDIVRNSLSVISKGIGNFNIDLFDFPIISIECKFHFKIFHIKANRESITANREFLEKKSKQQERELEELMKQFKEDEHRLIVQYIKDSIEPVIDILKDSNKKRLDNLVLDQMKEKALRTIRNKSNKDSLELLDKAQIRFERMLQLEFQLDKLDRRLNENIPPSALNIMDKLQFRSKELNKEVKDQYSEQWNNVIRKTKEKSDKNNRKIARAIERNSRAKNLHPHYTPLGFPPHVNNKVLGLTDEERRILNYGPKFVFENPKQALDRLEEEIRIMKDKVVEAWRRETHTTGRNPILVEQFANRLEEEVRNKINEGVTRDPIVEKTLERFQKEQKKGKVIFRQTDKSKDCFNEVGASDSKANHMESADDLRYVAQRGYEAMIKGEHRAYGSTIIKLMVGAGQVILNEIITEVTRRVIEKDN
ncbi:unnamed protein product [Rotaria sp. Silwood2]|nr:unnamed protein product [Rotaria sp. Silwood2]